MKPTPLNGKRILVCDDEKPITRLLQSSLEKQGLHVIVANDGREALELMARFPIDVLVLDWLMPYVDGLEVLRKVKRTPAYDHLKVIMLSTLTQDADIEEGTREGADRYITKPFSPKDLYSAIQDLSGGSFGYAE
jgi:DNA-binding response OmpR family regulator